MEQPSDRPPTPPRKPVEGTPEAPERKNPGHRRPEPDPFPGYGEPPPDVRRDAPPKVPPREWGPTGNTTP
jgi:hypothetical protein